MAVSDTISGSQRLKLSTRAGTLSARDERSAAHVEILDLAVALKLIGEEWMALERQLDHATLFQGVVWATAVHNWVSPGAENERDRTHEVVIARNKEGVLTGVWPIQVERAFGCDFVVALGEPFNRYGDILIAPDVERVAVIDAMFIALQSLDRFSGIVLRKVREDARCISRLSELGRVWQSTAASAADLRGHESFPAFLETITTTARENLQRARTGLVDENSELMHLVHQDREDVAEIAQRTFELRDKWLEPDTDVSHEAGLEVFVARLVEDYGSAGFPELRAFELRHGDETVRLEWGCVDRGRYYPFMAACNPSFDVEAVEVLHLQDILSSCMEMEIEVVDFQAPNTGHKQAWATETVTMRDYGVAFTPFGRLVLLGGADHLAQWMFDRTPSWMRQLLNRRRP